MLFFIIFVFFHKENYNFVKHCFQAVAMNDKFVLKAPPFLCKKPAVEELHCEDEEEEKEEEDGGEEAEEEEDGGEEAAEEGGEAEKEEEEEEHEEEEEISDFDYEAWRDEVDL